MATSNPYAALYAQKLGTPTQSAAPPPAASPSDKILPALMSKIGDVGKGLGESALSLVSTGDDFARKHLPAFLTNSNMGFGKPADLQHVKDLATPANTTQAVSKGLGDAAQFMIPGDAEAAGATKLASLAPKLGKAALPLAKTGMAALSSGLVNKAQGGEFGTGAVAGGLGAGIGQGVSAAAPKLAEAALGIGKADRAFGKTPGAAILNETRGIRPETVAASAQERMGQLTPQLEAAADRASVRPNPVRGLLPAPPREIPLAPSPAPRDPKMRPMAFPAKVNPEEGLEPRSGNPMAPISEYPSINPHYLSGSEHPELSGRVTPLQNPQQVTTRMGVLLRPAETGGAPIPAMLPNASASLRPARSIIGGEASKAAAQNAEGLHGQLTSMGDTLSRRFDTGEPIPANVTPRQLLDLKRGFSDQHLRWNPEIHDRALSAGRQAYGALDSELDRTVPEAAGLNQRISSLIPVARKAESVSRNAPTIQRALGRFGAHTGALTMGGLGAGAGYREGGLPGAVAGGVTGVLAPELIASPEGKMIAARLANKAGSLRPAVGAALQADRKKDKQ